MNKLAQNNYQFDYFHPNYIKFEHDFYRYAKLNIPLTFLIDDILNLMHSNQIQYFRLNANNTKDNQDHYFIFEPMKIKNTNIIQYRYMHHQYEKPKK